MTTDRLSDPATIVRAVAPEYTVPQVRQMRLELEKYLSDAMVEFERKSGATISNLHMLRDNNSRLYGVLLIVELR